MPKLNTCLLVFLTPFILLITLASLSAQTEPSPSPYALRDSLIELVKQSGSEDARSSRSPQSPQDLYLLFGGRAEKVQLELLDVKAVYDTAYQNELANHSWLSRIRPQAGWILAAILFVLLFVRDALKDAVSPRLRYVLDAIYDRFVRFTFVQRRALRKYRTSLVQKYATFRIPFRSDVELSTENIYVPLKVVDRLSTDQMESLKIIANYRHVMVVGTPGAGKSMLLKHIALHYATDQLRGSFEDPTVVLLELRRVNESEKSLTEHLIDIFVMHGFSQPEEYVRRSLARGKLMVLLDGLDEVTSSKREHVIAKIADLLQRHSRCRVIVTCRSAVYKGQLDAYVDQTLEIAEFSDQQIRRFLSSWPNLPGGKSIEQLLLALKERPRIMALARNPLLLTMIAFLYSYVDEFVLPHSRAEFYSQAVEVLLSKLKWEHNKYKASHKRLVLEHLALFNQTKESHAEEDHFSIDLKTVIREINLILPDINLDQKDAVPLLDEIVERNGLMLSIDGGARYQFSHLTLQEYFSAIALLHQRSRLLDYFKGDPDIWREVVKLWVGFAQDSTELIRAIIELDPTTAMECLADAQVVNQASAEAMIKSFQTRFGTDAALTSAFAAVASGPTRRSQIVLQFLAEILASPINDHRRLAAVSALSLTNKSEAANTLTEYCDAYPEALPALVQMGDVAISGLEARAKNGSHTAIKALGIIGTPDAARALVPLLWNSESAVNTYAALVLGFLFSQPGITDALHSCPLPPAERSESGVEWVWKPFDTPVGSSLPTIAERIAQMLPLSSVASQDANSWPIDERLVIPVALHIQETSNITVNDIDTTSEIKRSLRELANSDPAQLERFLRSLHLDQSVNVLRTDTLKPYEDSRAEDQTVLDPLFVYPSLRGNASSLFLVLRHLRVYSRLKLLKVLLNPKRPTLKDWAHISQRVQYSFSSSSHFRIVRLVTVVIAVISLVEIYWQLTESADEWSTMLRTFFGLSLCLSTLSTLLLIRDGKVIAYLITFAGFYTLPKWLLTRRVDFLEKQNQPQEELMPEIPRSTSREVSPKEYRSKLELIFLIVLSAPVTVVIVAICGGVILGTAPSAAYFSTRFLLRFFPPLVSYAAFAALGSVLVFVWRLALNEQRKATSPLLSLLRTGQVGPPR